MAKKRRTMLSLKCAVCDSNKSKFIKEQETSSFLESLGISITLPIDFIGNFLKASYNIVVFIQIFNLYNENFF